MRAVMSYFTAPDYLYDDPEEMAEWARKALDAALRANTSKNKKSGKKS